EPQVEGVTQSGLQVSRTKDQSHILLHILVLPDRKTNMQCKVALHHLVLPAPILRQRCVPQAVNLVFRQVGKIIEALDPVEWALFKILAERKFFRNVVVSARAMSTEPHRLSFPSFVAVSIRQAGLRLSTRSSGER